MLVVVELEAVLLEDLAQVEQEEQLRLVAQVVKDKLYLVVLLIRVLLIEVAVVEVVFIKVVLEKQVVKA